MDQVRSGDVIEIEFRGFFHGTFRVIDIVGKKMTLTPEDIETDDRMTGCTGDWDGD
jgi:hypothetical protein